MGSFTSEHAGSPRGREAAQWLIARLEDFGRRRRAMAGFRALLWLFVALGLSLLAVAWLDLLADLPPLLRVAGLAGAGALGLAALVGTVLVARTAGRLQRVARDVDRAAHSGGQVMVGLELTDLAAPTPPLTSALAGMAVRRAAHIVQPIPEESIEPVSKTGHAIYALFGVGMAIFGFALVGPHAFSTELARLTDPWGDHPGYTRHIFDVKPGDAEVLYGGSVAVEVRVGGLLAERLDLIAQQDDGSQEALPMFEERGGAWRVQLTDVTAPLRYWAQAPRGRSSSYGITVTYTPQIENLAVRIAPPAYTNLPAVEGPLPEGGISGLPGTTVRFSLRSNRPLSAAHLQLDLADGRQEVVDGAPDAADPRSASTEFAVSQPGDLTLWVVDEGGERSATEIKAPIMVLKDERPFVRVISPQADSYATPDIAIPVAVEAEDDYGITALSLYRSLNGSRHLPDRVLVPLPPGPRLRNTGYLTLGQHGLTAGDVITLFARVEDSDPAGAKGSESGVARVTIISRELWEELLRARKTAEDFQKKYDAAARLAESLRNQGKKLSDAAAGEQSDAVSPEMQEQLREFAEALQQASQATERAASEKPLYALDKDLSAPLHELAQAMSDAAEQAKRAAGAGSPAAMRQALDVARALLEQQEESYSEDVQKPLDEFMRTYALLEMEQRFIELAGHQKDLAERMRELKGSDQVDDPALKARMRDLRDEQAALAEELGTVLQEIRNRAAALPEGEEMEELRNTAEGFAEAVEQSRAMPAQGEAGAALEEFRGSEAYARAQEAAEVLDSFIGRCKSNMNEAQGQCRLRFGPRLSVSAGLTVEQLLGRAGRRPGPGAGIGSNGYSVRTANRNAALYGPTTMGGGEGGPETHDMVGSVFGDATGGMGAGVVREPGAPGSYDTVPLRGVPPQHRGRVRAYFRRVADETAAGTVLEDKGAGQATPRDASEGGR